MSRAVEAGKAFIRLGVVPDLERGLRSAQKRINQFGRRLTVAGAGLAAIGTTVTAPLLAMTKGFAAAGDTLDKMSIRTGIAVESLQELQFAAEQSGTNIDQLSQAMFRAFRRIGNAAIAGTGPAARALEVMNLNARELAQLSPEQFFYRVTDALNAVGNAAQRSQLGFEIFGDNWRQLQPLIEQGTGGINALRQEFDELGITLSGEQTAAAALLTDRFNVLSKVLGGIKNVIGAELAPVVTDFVDRISMVSKGIVTFVRNNGELIRTVFRVGVGLVAAGTAIAALGAGVIFVGSVIGGLATIIGTLGAAIGFLLTPMGAVAAGLAALFVMAQKSFGGLLQSASDAGAGLINALSLGDLQTAWEITTTFLSTTWLDLTNELMGYWDSFMEWMTNVSASVAKAIGEIFIKLGETIRALMESYRSYYNKVFNAVTEQIGELGGVRTIGGPVDAFGSVGGAGSGLVNFGQQMQGAAEARRRAANAARERRADERDQREREGRERLAAIRKETDMRIKELKVQMPKLNETLAQELGGGLTGGQAGTIRGTFNSAAARFLGGGAETPQQLMIQLLRGIKTAAEETADNTETIGFGP